MSAVEAASWEKETYVPETEEDSELQIATPRLVEPWIGNDLPDKKLPLNEDVVEFLQNMTMHGFAYFSKPTKFTARRVFWALYISCCLLFCLYYGAAQLVFFLEFKTNSLVEVRYTNELPFPAITFCNQNPFKLTPSVEAGWYTTARALTGNVSVIQYRSCLPGEFLCQEDRACISDDFKCDGFPDCQYGSDEENCDECRLLFIDDGGRNTSVAFNRQYALQMIPSVKGYGFYVSVEEPYTYLYYDEGVWRFSDEDQRGVVYASLEAGSGIKEILNTYPWHITDPEGGDGVVDVTISCDVNFKELTHIPVEKIDGSLDTMILYNYTAHKLEDLLTRCVWKGKYYCDQVGNITTSVTDMGVCYTINIHDPVIDHAGWTYGMSMTFNIEHYEYVKPSEEGLGIKMYLHEPDEFPLIYGKGLSISPGLVSYVDMKVTELNKLQPPWGSCGVHDLKYYDDYGQIKCQLECEADYLAKQCGCRMYYMPHKNNNPPACDVDTYFNCAAEELNKLRLSNGSCPPCPDKCSKRVYSVSTSFALRGTGFISKQDEREYVLQKKVFTARETTYRHVKQRYTATLKIFDQMLDKISQLLKYLEILKWQIDLDYADIMRYALMVYSDCHWSRDILLDSQNILDRQLLDTLHSFKQTLFKYSVKVFPSMETWTARLIETIDRAKDELHLGSKPLVFTFDGCKADCRNTMEGIEYIGTTSRTVSGRSCQRWDEQTPHSHPYQDPYDKRFPDYNLTDAANFCRNPDGKKTGPWCYTVDPDVEWETCQVPLCSDCIELGQPYRGNRPLTLSGRTCQRWDSQSPHAHGYADPSLFPDASLAEASNFCRNPNNSRTGPWCFTTDPDVRSETCAIPMCKDCRMTSLGTDYVGTKSSTRSGIPCQRWDMQYPHEHSHTPASRFPDLTLSDASNFCRNPDLKSTGPWCFTTDPKVKWESCDIPLCSGCRNNHDKNGTLYSGTQSFTVFGRACQRWDSQVPHKHNYTDASSFPDATLADASNYCRNPDPTTHSTPWCYTMTPEVEWEPCDIPLCNDCTATSNGIDYNGNTALTISQRPCQRWDSQYPHKHSFTDVSLFPDISLKEANNYCRNPDGKVQGPWCFTNDPEVRWEICGIDICPACKRDEQGKDYKGTAHTTKSGRPCQKWTSQTPHSHPEFSIDEFPDNTLEEADNYCRNPTGAYGVGPWCYTTDPDVETESCGLPLCSSDCIYTFTGSEYMGTLQKTIGGIRCQSWNMQYPHPHNFTDPSDFPDETLDSAINFCRNPDKRLGTGPWCLTNDPDIVWQSCGVARCLECVNPGEVYTGERRVTQSGLQCQRWDEQSPHPHPYTDAALFPDATLSDAENFCRNPDNRSDGAWCYTTDPDVEMQTCAVPVCSGPESVLTDAGSRYQGRRVTTQSGLVCQRWDMQSPNTHKYTDADFFPDETVTEASNYCRNPNGVMESGPWCYTRDPVVTWETCSIVKQEGYTECSLDSRGWYYTGRQTVTTSGRTCQLWSRQIPHQHSFTDDDFPDGTLEAALNYCRNPDNREGGPWCFTQDPFVEWEYCYIYSCSDCRRTYLGQDYTGTRSMTASGFACQRWDSQFPHAHNFTDPKYFPDETLADAANYCRNPDGRHGYGPWCYTTDMMLEWEFCGIPFCFEQSSRMTAVGQEYRGVQAVTLSGIPCQFWNSQIHHPHPYTTDDFFPNATVFSVKNYCRNPDGKTSGPWCYTMDPEVEWESCSIPLASECQFSERGMEYTGRYGITESGLTCQRWDSQYPHAHNFTDASYFPDSTVSEAANFCRNPDGKSTGPWCYTRDPNKAWESCRIPQCSDCKQTQLGTNYTGTRFYTVSGRICQKWSDQLPHSHNFSDEDFPEGSLVNASNYCRNPDRHPDGPWCFTIDPDVVREPCGITLCTKPGCRDTPIGNMYRGKHFWTKSGILCQRWDRQIPHSHIYTNISMFPDSSIDDLSNYCRNPDNDPDGPWCFTVNPKIRRESCNIPMCSDCMNDALGISYAGKRSITASGRVCQRWDSQEPHQHNITDSNLFPEATLSAAENYCRNPDGNQSGPWCYTLDPAVERESCDVPLCRDCRTTYYGYDYAGRVSATLSGRPCQRWDGQVPHKHPIFNTTGFPDATLQEAENYCRNPGRRYGSGTWCYTEDPAVEWEFCGVPLCRDCTISRYGTEYTGTRNFSAGGEPCKSWTDVPLLQNDASDFGVTDLKNLSNYCRNPTTQPLKGTGPWCFSEEDEQLSCGIPLCNDCKETEDGWEYQGKRAVTISGKPCQRWDSLPDSLNKYKSDSLYPDDSLADAANYCRNPDKSNTGPWCYFNDTQRETCGIPYCIGKDCTWQFRGNEYRGSYAHTVSGRTCMKWGGLGGQQLHQHQFTDSDFPDLSIDEAYNFCRNPNNSRDWPWCYTTDPLVEWEYCPIINCRDCQMMDEVYTGKRSFTKSGLPCQRWDQLFPHVHNYTDDYFPENETISDAANYCRSLDGANIPWCFTLDPDVRRENCSIHKCSDCYTKRFGTDYVGPTERTVSGFKCQRWDEQTPHAHTFTDELFYPDSTLSEASNYCRNPNQSDTGRGQPWCYTTDPDVVWEYCPVPMCQNALADCAPPGLDSWQYAGVTNVTRYGIACDSWATRPVPSVQAYFLEANIVAGRLYRLSGDEVPPTGIVSAGRCYGRLVNVSDDGNCSNPAVFGSDGVCSGSLSFNESAAIDVETVCGSSNGSGCCVDTIQACHLADMVGWCSSQLDPSCDPVLCLGGACCSPDDDACSADGDESSLCCDTSQVSCCDNTTCSRTLTVCYQPMDLTGYSLDQGHLYDDNLNLVLSDFVQCELNITTDTGKMTEPIVFGRRSLQVKNYCRNPDLKPMGPWCYTTHPDIPWQYCDIPLCTASGIPSECRDTYDGFDYDGDLSTTYTGQTCQRWDSQTPRQHNFTDASYFPDASLSDAASHCRNPDRTPGTGPWCLVTGNSIRESCGIPLCPDFTAPDTPPADLMGELSVETSDTTDDVSPDLTTTAYTNTFGSESTVNGSSSSDGDNATYESYEAQVDTRRCDYHLYRTVSRYNRTIWTTAQKFVKSLGILRRTDVNVDIHPEYVINQTMLELIEANVGSQCAWCMEPGGGAPLLELVSERIDDWRTNALEKVSVDVLERTEKVMAQLYNSSWLRFVGPPVVTDEVEAVRAEFRRSAAVVKTALNKTQQTLSLIREASHLNRELIRNIWGLECKAQLQQLLTEYERYRQTFRNIIDEFRAYLRERYSQIRDGVGLYTTKKTTLEAISREINFDDLQSKLQGNKITVDKALDGGQLLVNNLHFQINKIYYSLMSFIDRNYIKSQSNYWQELNVSDPEVKLPKLKEIQGIMMAEVDYGMIPDGDTLSAWTEKINSLDNIRSNIATYTDTLVNSALYNGRNYLQGYLKGNQIDEEFYRNNFLQVEVFYQEMANRKVIEQELYPPGDLFSEVGGLMGLLMGASLLSLVELLDFLIFYTYKKCRKSKK